MPSIVPQALLDYSSKLWLGPRPHRTTIMRTRDRRFVSAQFVFGLHDWGSHSISSRYLRGIEGRFQFISCESHPERYVRTFPEAPSHSNESRYRMVTGPALSFTSATTNDVRYVLTFVCLEGGSDDPVPAAGTAATALRRSSARTGGSLSLPLGLLAMPASRFSPWRIRHCNWRLNLRCGAASWRCGRWLSGLDPHRRTRDRLDKRNGRCPGRPLFRSVVLLRGRRPRCRCYSVPSRQGKECRPTR